MNDKVFALINKYAKEVAAMCPGGPAFRIMVASGGQVFETAYGADLMYLEPSDVVESSRETTRHPIEYDILASGSETKAIVLSKTEYCTHFAEEGRTLTASLDDTAQIVGYKIFTVDYEQKAIKKALKKAEGCFVHDRYTITCGRNLYEAVVALTVLEKAAEIDLKAEILGGVDTIPHLEATLMRQIYKRKYSKAEQKVKGKEGR